MSNPRGRPTQRKLVVSPEQKATLQRLVQQPRNSRSIAFRARIIRECASGQNHAAVAGKLRTTGFTVGMWRNRFITGGMVELGDEARPGPRARSVMTGSSRQYVSRLEQVPKGATHWSSRALVSRTGLSQSTVSRIWRAFGLRPHGSETD
jgi:transposase-like protein